MAVHAGPRRPGRRAALGKARAVTSPAGTSARAGEVDLLPAAEQLVVACPVTADGPFDKDGPGFAAAWDEVLAAVGGDGTPPLGWVS